MEPLRLLVFVGTEGIYHDHAGQGRFIADTVSKAGDIEADFSRDYDILVTDLTVTVPSYFILTWVNSRMRRKTVCWSILSEEEDSSDFIRRRRPSMNQTATTKC